MSSRLAVTGGHVTGTLEVGQQSGSASVTLDDAVFDFGADYANVTITITSGDLTSASYSSTHKYNDGKLYWGAFASISSSIVNNTYEAGTPFTPQARFMCFRGNGDITYTATSGFTTYPLSSEFFYYENTPTVHEPAGGPPASTLAADGSATFAGNVTAATTPTDALI